MSRSCPHWPAWDRYVSMTKSSPRAVTHRRTRFPGKSLFLNFLLAWLISAQQVVLLSTAPTVLLFYQGKVYQREAAFFTYIPTHKFFHAWALIDADFKAQEVILNPRHNIWPIQASSPQPTRWQGWGKQFKAALLGMPLWNMEELKEGYVIAASCNLSTVSFGRCSR